jgi:hypothetical protein
MSIPSPHLRRVVSYPADECVICLHVDGVLEWFTKGTVGQLLDAGGRYLQKLTDELHPGFQLGTVRHSQLVVSIAALKHLTDFFVPCFCRKAVQNVGGLALQDCE